MPRRAPQHQRGVPTARGGDDHGDPVRAAQPACRDRVGPAAAVGTQAHAPDQSLAGTLTKHMSTVVRVGRVPTAARSATLRDAVGLGLAVGLYGVAFGAAADAAGLNT